MYVRVQTNNYCKIVLFQKNFSLESIRHWYYYHDKYGLIYSLGTTANTNDMTNGIKSLETQYNEHI